VYLPLNFSGAAFVSGNGIVSIEFPDAFWLAMVDGIIDWCVSSLGDTIFVEISGSFNDS
jgi:hypothetical protein